MNTIPRWSEEELTVRADPDLEDLVPVFLENRQEDLISLREAMRKGDFASVRILGHNMRGAGGGYGFDVISRIGKALEEAAKTGDGVAVLGCVDALEEYLGQVRIE